MVRTGVKVGIVAAILLCMAGLLHTATRSATARDPAAPKSRPATQQNDDSEQTAIQPPRGLTWTEVPTVDLADPTLQRGII